MTRTPKPRPDAWPLRPGDLPPDWIVRREPRLAGLDQNPVFRFLCFRRHKTNRRQVAWLVVLVALLPLLFFLSVAAGLRLGMWPWIIGFSLFRFMAPGRAGGLRGASAGEPILLSLPPTLVMDLEQAGYPSREFVDALWGRSHAGRRLRDQVIAWIASSGVCWFFLFRPDLLPFIDPSFVLLGPFVIAAMAVTRVFAPDNTLQAQVHYLNIIRKTIERRMRPVRSLGRNMLRAIVMILLVFASMILAGGLAMGIKATGVLELVLLLVSPIFQIGGLPVWGVIVSGAGILAGLAHGEFVRRRRAKYLERMDRTMAFILTWIASTETGEPPPNPRIVFRRPKPALQSKIAS